MSLSFVDADGHCGRITDEFSVEYDGPLAVEEYVGAVLAEPRSTEWAVDELILGLVCDLGVEEVRRTEAATTPPRA